MSHANKIKADNVDQTRTFYINNDIKHLKQLTKNDCGPTCLKMAINYIYRNASENFRNEKIQNVDKILTELNIISVSSWTIDMANICAREKIEHTMYTITLGVQESYSSIDFYSKENNFSAEMLRVEQTFSNSKELGINVVKDTINLERIKFELNKHNVCIVLVDANLLNGKNIQLNSEDFDKNEIYTHSDITDIPLSSRPSCCYNPFGSNQQAKDSKTNLDKLVEANLIKECRSNYCGHYIILIGYDDSKQLIFYRNPSSTSNFSFTNYLNFEIARKSFGTDQDILFIYPNEM